MELSNTQTWWIYTRLDGRNGECWSTMKIRCIVMRLKIARVTALQGGTMHSVNKHLSTSCVHCCCTISIALGFFRHLPTSSNHRTLRYSAWVKSLPFFSQCRNSLWETFPSPPGRRTRLGTGRHVATLPPLPLSRSLHKTSTSLKVKSEFNLSEICQISLNLERKDAEEPSMDWKTSLISWESSKAIHSPLIAGSCTSATTPF